MGLLSVETINSLNAQMSGNLPNYEPAKTRMRVRLSNIFSAHKILQDALVVFLALAGSVIFYSLAIHYEWASRDYVFGGTVALFGVLLTIYFAKRRKE